MPDPLHMLAEKSSDAAGASWPAVAAAAVAALGTWLGLRRNREDVAYKMGRQLLTRVKTLEGSRDDIAGKLEEAQVLLHAAQMHHVKLDGEIRDLKREVNDLCTKYREPVRFDATGRRILFPGGIVLPEGA